MEPSTAEDVRSAASVFANAEPTMDKLEALVKDDGVHVPMVVMMSIAAFLAIIGLSWLMDGKKMPSPVDPSTPKKQPKLGTEVTPAGRRSTRKTHKPDILDPSQPVSRHFSMAHPEGGGLE
ncbi:unnamed protein product, partial [Ectocarpus sp. 12 AP-2014]